MQQNAATASTKATTNEINLIFFMLIHSLIYIYFAGDFVVALLQRDFYIGQPYFSYKAIVTYRKRFFFFVSSPCDGYAFVSV